MDTKKLTDAAKIVGYVLAVILLVILFLVGARGSCLCMYEADNVIVYIVFGGAALLANVLSILLCLFVNKYIKTVPLVPKPAELGCCVLPFIESCIDNGTRATVGTPDSRAPPFGPFHSLSTDQ